MNIPDEAVEAAAKVMVWEESHGLYAYRPEGHPMRDASDGYADKRVSAILQAAAPHLMRQAWDEAWDAHSQWPGPTQNPYIKRSGE